MGHHSTLKIIFVMRVPLTWAPRGRDAGALLFQAIKQHLLMGKAGREQQLIEAGDGMRRAFSTCHFPQLLRFRATLCCLSCEEQNSGLSASSAQQLQ